MPDFNTLTPPLSITNPLAAQQTKDFPRHLYRFAEPYRVVQSQDEMDAAIGQGWALAPVLVSPASLPRVPAAQVESAMVAEPKRPRKDAQ